MHRFLLFSSYKGVYPPKSLILFAGLLLLKLSVSDYATAEIPEASKFNQFDQIYEPSGVQQLSDRRFIVVEDESHQPLAVISLETDGRVSEQVLYSHSLSGMLSHNRALSTLEDLEAVTVDNQGRIYVITSHSRKKNGKRAVNREQLTRFTLEGDKVVAIQVLGGLQKSIYQKHTYLELASGILDAKSGEGFNIEGLCFDATQQKLMIGLRSPLAGDNAIIIIFENPREVFDNKEIPRISDTRIELDLEEEESVL